MIRIIKHGKFRQCTCYNCGCIFTYEKEDVRVQQDRNNVDRTVECPDCKERNYIRG